MSETNGAPEALPIQDRRRPLVYRLEYGNVAQWVSAGCALVLAALAIYGFFFSTASQALVAYLQSELATRNQRIASLELREQELHEAVATTQSNLKALLDQKGTLETQVSSLQEQRTSLSQKLSNLDATLSNTQFSLTREKIGAKLSSTLGATFMLAVHLPDELDSPEGIKPRSVHVWDDELSELQRVASELPESDKPLARPVIAAFVQQCQRFSEVVIQVPQLRLAKDADFAKYNFDRSKDPIAQKAEAIKNSIFKLQKEIRTCFAAVTP